MFSDKQVAENRENFKASLVNLDTSEQLKLMKGYDELSSKLEESLCANWDPASFVLAWGRLNAQNSYPICSPGSIKAMRQIYVEKFFGEEDSENCNLYDIITDQCFLAKIKEMRLIHDFEITNESDLGQYIDIFC